jgi:hypothetical protein
MGRDFSAQLNHLTGHFLAPEMLARVAVNYL